MNEGVNCFKNKYPDIDYLILLASDTWLVKPEYLENIILNMKKEKKYLAAAAWGTKGKTNIWEIGCSLDFNVIDFKWAKNNALFPLRFQEFKDKYEEFFFYNDRIIFLERVFMIRFKQAILSSIKLVSDNLLKPVADEHILRLTDREPVHVDGKENLIFKNNKSKRFMYVEKMGLIMHHDPVERKAVLKEWNLSLGDFGNKLLNSTDLTYYNRGLSRNLYKKDGKEIGYGEE